MNSPLNQAGANSEKPKDGNESNVAELGKAAPTTQSAATAAHGLHLYLRYFGLKEAPFTITPNPRYLFLSRRHQEGMAHLLYGIGQGSSGGFVQLTGEVGTGKTTLCRCLLEQVPDRTYIALILNPILTPQELLATICDEFGVNYPEAASTKVLVDCLTRYLLQAYERGERVVVVIDEAQNMSREALEQVRLLTNLETSTDKLLQIVLLGQPELRKMLAQNDLRQLAQRVTARYHLEPLDAEDTEDYIRHRLAVAGAHRCPLNEEAIQAVHRYSKGVPRLINIITDRSLMGAYACNSPEVDAGMVREAAREIRGSVSGVSYRSNWQRGGIALVIIAGVALASAGWVWRDQWLPVSPDTALQPTSTTALTTTTPGPSQGVEAAHNSAATGTSDSGQGLTTQSSAVVEPLISEPDTVEELRITSDTRGLWHSYAELWQVNGFQLRSACQLQSSSEFVCLRQSGNLQRLIRLDLPVMLILQDSRNLLLLGVSGERLLVHNGREQQTITRQQLEPHWLGEYWVAVPGNSEVLRLSDSKTEVFRLKSLAAGLDAMPYVGPVDERFDPSLEHWVRAFQLQHGLNPDGIVGPSTRLYLAAEAVSEPQLLEEW